MSTNPSLLCDIVLELIADKMDKTLTYQIHLIIALIFDPEIANFDPQATPSTLPRILPLKLNPIEVLLVVVPRNAGCCESYP